MASVLLNKSDAYALVIESLPNVKWVDVTLQVIRGSALVILNNGSKVLIAASFTHPPPIELSYDKLQKYLNWMGERGLIAIDGDGYVRLTREGAKAYDELVRWIIKYVGSLRLGRRWRPHPT